MTYDVVEVIGEIITVRNPNLLPEKDFERTWNFFSNANSTDFSSFVWLCWTGVYLNCFLFTVKFLCARENIWKKGRRLRKETFTYLEFSNLTIIVIHSSRAEIIYATNQTRRCFPFSFLSWIIVFWASLSSHNRKESRVPFVSIENLNRQKSFFFMQTSMPLLFFSFVQLIVDCLEIRI